MSSYNRIVMAELIFSKEVPLTMDDDGTFRIKGSRITLDTIVSVFKKGMTAEQIQCSFPSLSAAQTSAVIAWYQEHKTEVEKYLNERQTAAETLQSQIEEQPEHQGLRETIRKRRQLIKT